MFVGVVPARAEADPGTGSAAPLGELVDQTPASDVPSGLSVDELDASARAKASGSPVVVQSLTTEQSQTKAMPDGTFAAELSSSPVRVKDSTGWKALDTTLQAGVKDGEASLIPKKTIADVALGQGGSDSMAYIGDHKGAAVTQKWPFGDLPVPVVDGDTATYPEVLPGVDLVQLVRPAGVSQVLKVKTRQALSDPRVVQMRFFLHTDGAVVQDRGDGKGLVALTRDGRPALETADGQWWDSSWEGATAEGPGGPGLSYPLALSLDSENGQQVQKLGMDAIVNAKRLTFPVFVDPDWNTGEASYSYVDSHWPSISYWNGAGGSDGTVHVGYLPAEWDYTEGASHVTRGFYQFNTAWLAGRKIMKAVVNTTEKWSSSCDARPVSAWVTGGIGSGTTWNAQPGYLQKVSTQNVAKGYSASCPGGGVGFDMGSATSWLTNSPQWTVGLRADNEGDDRGWKVFTKDATLIVTYDTPPNTPALWWIENALYSPAKGQPGAVYYTRIPTPTFGIMSRGDADGAKGGNLTMSVVVRNSAGTVVDSGTTGPGSPAANTLFTWKGSKVLPDGKYTVYSSVKDPQGSTSGTQAFVFTVDTTPPGAPDIIAPASLGGQTITGSTAQGVGRDDLGTVGKTVYNFGIRYTGKFGGTKGFVYAITDSNAPQPAFPASLKCNERSTVFVSTVPCASTMNKVTSLNIPVAAVGDGALLTVWAVDQAGNVSRNVGEPPQAVGQPRSFKFTVGVKDQPQNTLVPVTPAGGAAWKTIAVDPASGKPDTADCTTGTADANSSASGDEGRALEVPAGGRAVSSAQAVDASHSFTTAAWICPTQVGGSIRSIITQLAAPGSPAARLAVNPDTKFILQGWPQGGTAPDEVATTTDIVAGQWSYVVAAYDETNRQLRITRSDSKGSLTTWVTATSPEKQLASTDQPVVLGDNGTAGTDQFTGQIFRPVMTQSILTADQVKALAYTYPAGEGVMK